MRNAANFKEGIKNYATWFVINSVIALIPIGVIYLLSGDPLTRSFSSFLCYAYTLILTSLYMYLNYAKIKKGQLPMLTIVLVILWLFVLLVLLMSYVHGEGGEGLAKRIHTYINCSILMCFPIVLALTVFGSLYLSIPGIQVRIAESVGQKAIKAQAQTAEDTRTLGPILKGEGGDR